MEVKKAKAEPVLYNVSKSLPGFQNPEDDKLSFSEFVAFYSRMYYFKTCRWVEKRIEYYLTTDEELGEEAFLHIFAWKTNRIDQQRSQAAGRFIYTTGEDKTKRWAFQKEITDESGAVIKQGYASAVTRRGLIDEEGEENKKTLYSFLQKAAALRKRYIQLNETERAENRQKYLDELTEASLSRIGSVYLITFMYFITQGEMPIYDIFAMTALDAIYPGEDHKSLPLGSAVKPRELPQKNQEGFKHLFSEDSRYNKSYQIYQTKLKVFQDDYQRDKKDERINRKTDRDIDRALWVYGHMFSRKIIDRY